MATPKPKLDCPQHPDVLLQLGFWKERLEKRGSHRAVADEMREWLQMYDFTASYDYPIAMQVLEAWQYLEFIDDIALYFLTRGTLRKKLIEIKGPEEIMTRLALNYVYQAMRLTANNINKATW